MRRKNHIPTSPSSPEALATVSRWLATCLSSHDSCTIQANEFLPTRLVDVGSADGTRPPRLFDTRHHRYYHRKPQYLALSHCWGTSSFLPLRTTTENIDELQQQISWEALSKTFQDVIFISRWLGVQYVWIDSLCIIQDDEADWATESTNMGCIYEQSLLTVSASAAEDGQRGCFVPRLYSPILQSSPIKGVSHRVFVRNGDCEGLHRVFTSHLDPRWEQGNRKNVEVQRLPLLQRGTSPLSTSTSRRPLPFQD